MLKKKALQFANKLKLKPLSHSPIYRRLMGGVWVHFSNGEIIRTEWYGDKKEGYLAHPQGGVFHVSFNMVSKVQDYTFPFQ